MRGSYQEAAGITQRDVVIAEVRRLIGDDLETFAEGLSAVDESDAPDLSGLDPARRREPMPDSAAGLRKVNTARPGELTGAEIIGLEAIRTRSLPRRFTIRR